MLQEFLDRERELRELNKSYESKNSEFFLIYGRRRIGKSELVKRFIEGKPHFYYLSKQQDLKLEADRFRQELSRKFDIYLEETDTIEPILRQFIAKRELEEKFIVAIDEFPYWLEADKSILSEFQHLWDEVLKGKNLFMILTGSSVGMMESEVMGHKSPLYGRRTGQINLKEMPLSSLKDFLPDYSFEEALATYGAVGGVPLYLQKIDSSQGLMENIRQTFLNKADLLHEEAEILLREELRKPNVYFNILKAILDGATKLSEISSQSRVDITNINKYLKVLERLRIISKDYPLTEPAKQKNFHYQIEDNYIRFWLTFVYPYQSDLEQNREGVLDTVKQNFNEYMGPIFEQVCQQAVSRLDSHQQVGRWWYQDNEIDVVGLNQSRNEILLGECKWSQHKVGQKVLHNLAATADKVRWHEQEREETYALFSRSGFTSNLKQLAEDRPEDKPDLELYDLERLQQEFLA